MHIVSDESEMLAAWVDNTDGHETLKRHIKAVLDERDRLSNPWQPIESAPPSGAFMIYALGLPWPAHSQGDGIYSNAHGKVNDLDRWSIKATHWMPLPSGPLANHGEATGN